MEALDYQDDVKVNRNDLDSEWAKQAGLYAYWVDRYAEELRKKDKIWLEKKVLKAKLFKEARLKLTENGKAPSDGRCDVEVHADPRYEEVSLRLIEAEAIVNKLDGAKWALVEKGKSLLILSRDSNKSYHMEDSYSSLQNEAIGKKMDESEQIDMAYRRRIKR